MKTEDRDILDMLYEEAENQYDWFVQESLAADITETARAYYAGSRDAYGYMIEVIEKLLKS